MPDDVVKESSTLPESRGRLWIFNTDFSLSRAGLFVIFSLWLQPAVRREQGRLRGVTKVHHGPGSLKHRRQTVRQWALLHAQHIEIRTQSSLT